MRKTSQSMYNPKSSKINNNSSIVVKSQVHPLSQTKIQGHDQLSSNLFHNTVSNLKNKPNKKVLEDQYINGLQQEIKYLQYQLKLLKDKQILQRQGVNQLDNFLKDQIPINQNILAIKNKYNATKNTLEDQLKKLMAKQAQATDVLTAQKNNINNLHQIIDDHRKNVFKRKKQFKQKISEIVQQITLTKEEHEATLKNNKQKQQQIKKMNQQIANIQRAIQKERVTQVRFTEQKTKFLEKFNEKSKETKFNMIQSMQKIEQLQERGQTNPLIQPLEQQNSNLRKKIMLNQKQKSTAENMIAEIQLFLKEEARDRQIQRQHKIKSINQADDYRTQLQHLQRYVQKLIKQQTHRTKKLLLKQMNSDLSHKQQNYNMLTDRLRNLQGQCSNLIQEKKELVDALQSQNQIGKQLQNKKQNLLVSISQNKSHGNSLKRITEQNIKDTAPILNDVQKCNGMIPIVEKEIQKKKVMIHHLNKQLDLLKELKTLDMQQLQLISQGGYQVQNILHSFIKNWEKIKMK